MSYTKQCVKCKELKPAEEFPKREDGNVRKRCRECFNAQRREKRAILRKIKPEPTPEIKFKHKVKRSKVYVVTCAQNATPIHKGFFSSLGHFIKDRKAALIPIPIRYRNQTSLWSRNSETDEWWDASISDQLFNGVLSIGKHLVIHGDVSIQPTAVRPLTGLQAFAHHKSAIFGHTKIEHETVPTGSRYYPKVLFTTGALTVPNYTKSKAGKKGEAHHTIGALVVEVDGSYFYIRELRATEDGSFIDLGWEYTPNGVRKAPPALGLVCGDIHVEQEDPRVLEATFTAKDSLANLVKPKHVVLHDTYDFAVRNHHRINDFIDRYIRVSGDEEDVVENGFTKTIRFIDEVIPKFCKPIVVRSNHDDAFDKWLSTADIRKDPINARFFHECWYKKLSHYEKTKEMLPAFELMYKEKGKGRAKFLQKDERFQIADFLCNFHGHHGINGARGSDAAFTKLGSKLVKGHTHCSSIRDNVRSVGVKAGLDHGYNEMPSGWINADLLIYANGQDTLIFYFGNKWRLKEHRG